jgi:hypothetical protein
VKNRQLEYKNKNGRMFSNCKNLMEESRNLEYFLRYSWCGGGSTRLGQACRLESVLAQSVTKRPTTDNHFEPEIQQEITFDKVKKRLPAFVWEQIYTQFD